MGLTVIRLFTESNVKVIGTLAWVAVSVNKILESVSVDESMERSNSKTKEDPEGTWVKLEGCNILTFAGVVTFVKRTASALAAPVLDLINCTNPSEFDVK
ncbi:hypothetical protein D3C73_904520 [compost metagenome]